MNREERKADFRRRFEAALADLDAEPGLDPREMNTEELSAYLSAHGARPMNDEEITVRFGPRGTTMVTFIGEPLVIAPGNIVMVQTPTGSWQNQMRAVSSHGGIIYVSDEAEYLRAAQEGREPLTIAYPAARVKLAVEE